MQRKIEDLTSELLGLPKRERLELVRFLLFLDNHSPDSNNVDFSWEKEITDRVHAVDTDTAIGIDYDSALNKLKDRFSV